jgi:hypothetical protein
VAACGESFCGAGRPGPLRRAKVDHPLEASTKRAAAWAGVRAACGFRNKPVLCLATGQVLTRGGQLQVSVLSLINKPTFPRDHTLTSAERGKRQAG